MQVLSLLDDLIGHVVHGEFALGVTVEPLLGQRELLRVKIRRLPQEVLLPCVQLARDLRATIKYNNIIYYTSI